MNTAGASLRVWAKDHPGGRRDSHGLAKMWVIDDGPEPINGFAIRLRLVRDHLPDCPQSEFEKRCRCCVRVPIAPRGNGRARVFAQP
jgi:hypothetical protein